MRYLLTYISPNDPEWNQQWIVDLEENADGILVQKGYKSIGTGRNLPGAPPNWKTVELIENDREYASYIDDPNYTLEPLEPPPAPELPPDDDYDLLNDFPY